MNSVDINVFLVAAQSFTVLAMVGGSLYFQYKKGQEKKLEQQPATTEEKQP